MAVTLTGMTLLTDNDNEPNWSGTDGPDTFNFNEQGNNSESWYIAKNGNENGTLSRSASMPTGRGVYIAWIASSVKAIYTFIGLTLNGGGSRAYTIADTANRNVDGAFRAFAFDYVNKGTPSGTFNPAALTTSVFNVQMANATVRNTPNHWIDAIYYGVGHTVSGTTTQDRVFFEAWDYEYNTNTRRYGVLENYNGIIFCQADMTLSGTNLVSNGETLVFATAPNGYDVYNMDITGTVVFKNTSVLTAGTKLFNFDSSGATSFTMSGGTLEGGNTITFGSTDDVSGIVLTNSALVNVPNDITSSSFLNNTLIFLTGSLDNCTIQPTAASTVAVEAVDIEQLVDCTFVGDGTGHAVEISSIGDGGLDWTCVTTNGAGGTGYNTGTFAEPVTPTSTGNETIYVNVPSGTLTINVVGNATVPSIRSAGAIVNVVAFRPTLTISNLVLGSDVVIKESGTTNKLQDTQDVLVNSVGYTYTYSAGTFVDIAVYCEGYVPYFINNYELGAGNASLPAAQVVDRNYTP